MDKNSIIGIVLIAGIFIVWGVVNKPSEEEIARQQQHNDSIALVREIEQKEAELKALQQVQQEQSAPIETAASETEIATTTSDTVEYRDIILENDLISLCLSERGGQPCYVKLKNFNTYDSLPIYLFDSDSSNFELQFYINNRPVSTKELYFQSTSNSKTVLADYNPQTVALRYSTADDKYIEYRYSLAPGKYQVDLDIVFNGMDGISTQRTGVIDLNWRVASPQQEKGRDNEMMYTTLYYKPFEDNVQFFNARSKKKMFSENLQTRVEWIAYKDQFFSSVLMADNAFLDANMQAETMTEGSKYLKVFNSTIGLPFERTHRHEINLHFFFGPNQYKLLKKQYGDKQLHDLVTVGRSIIKWINQAVIINLFAFLGKFIGNYGIIILIMTIIIKLVLLPLTFKSYMSTAKMKVLKPQIDEINNKIPKEKAMERQQATMALYKKVGVSPLGGCLPMVLQMPILFALFRFFPTSIELRQQSFLWATDLSTYDAFLEWDSYIPIISNTFGNHLSLFTLLMTVSTIISMKYTNQGGMSNQQMPGMKGMMYIMPVMFMFILNKFSAGLTYYYFLANIITIGQNLLFKQFIDDEALLKKLESRKGKPAKKSKFKQRMEQVAKQQSQQGKRK